MRTSSPRARTIATVLIVVLIPAITAIPALTFLGTARLTSNLDYVWATTALAFAVLAVALGMSLGVAVGARRQRLVGVAVAIGLLAAGLVVARATVLDPFDLQYTAADRSTATGSWKLDDGSRIAFDLTEATPKQHTKGAVIFVHGGPGVPTQPGGGPTTHLSENGFDVYHYDQVGSGRSSRHSDVTRYAIDEQVRHLEQVRRRTNADYVVMVGYSWGGTLLAEYLARYPDTIDRAIFVSPGPLPGHLENSARQPLPQDVDTPRFRAWEKLAEVDVRLAYQFISERESDALNERILELRSARSCRAKQRFDPPPGSGFWANRMLLRHLGRARSIDEQLRRVQTPTLILVGACDRETRRRLNAYHDAFPQSKTVTISGAGHALPAEAPRSYVDRLQKFIMF